MIMIYQAFVCGDPVYMAKGLLLATLTQFLARRVTALKVLWHEDVPS